MKNQKIAFVTTIILIMSTLLSFSCLPPAQAATTTFGYQNPNPTAYPSDTISRVKGSMYTSSSAGVANSISVYVNWNPTYSFGNTVAVDGLSIVNTIRGSNFTLAQNGIAQSITAYIYVTGVQKKVQAAIYNPITSQLVAVTEERTFTGVIGGPQTFNFASPVALTAGTYVLVIWGGQSTAATGSDNIYVYRDSANNNPARTSVLLAQTYASGVFPNPLPAATINRIKYTITCNMVNTPVNIKAALYSDTTFAFLASTEEKTLTTATDQWVTLNFPNPKPSIAASTRYILTAWTSPTIDAKLFYLGLTGDGAYYINNPGSYGPTWPSTIAPAPGNAFYSKLNIYCTVQTMAPTEITVQLNPATVDSNGATTTTITGKLTSGGLGLNDKTVKLFYLNPTENPIAEVQTNIAGEYTYSWTVPFNTLPNGEYPIKAVFEGDADYQADSEVSTPNGLFVVPEYALGLSLIHI